MSNLKLHEGKAVKTFVYKKIFALRLDLPQVDLMNFREECVRSRSGRCLGREMTERATGTE